MFALAVLCAIAAQAEPEPKLAEHRWLGARHLWQILTHWRDTRTIERAFAEADSAVPPGRPGVRGRRVEREAIRRLPTDAGYIANVGVNEIDGLRFVGRIGKRHSTASNNQWLGEADVLRLKPGRSLVLGAEFDKSAIAAAWEYKTSDKPMKVGQRARYREVFGVEPIEVHPTTTGQALGNLLRGQAIGIGQYGAAYVLKGVIEAIVAWDLEVAKEHARELLRPGFWGSATLFGAASRGAEAVVNRIPIAATGMSTKVLVKTGALPSTAVRAASSAKGGFYMAAGMAVVQYATTGHISLKDLAISTGSYMIAGVAVNLLLDVAMLAVLGTTPVGWVYIVTKLALTLYFGEKLDAWIRSWLDGSVERAATWLEGVRHKIEKISPGKSR